MACGGNTLNMASAAGSVCRTAGRSCLAALLSPVHGDYRVRVPVLRLLLQCFAGWHRFACCRLVRF